MVESRVDWKNPGQVGAVYSERAGEFELAVHSALRRGWFFGSQEFREMLLKLAAKTLAGRAKRKADGYQGAEFKGSESDDLVRGKRKGSVMIS